MYYNKSISSNTNKRVTTLSLNIMASINNKTLVCMLLVLLFVGMVATIEGRTSSFILPTIPICTSVVGVKSGDTCFDIAHKFKLSSESFAFINPNLNCNKLFVGEWICIQGI